MFQKLKNISIFYKIVILYTIFIFIAVACSTGYLVRDSMTALEEKEIALGKTQLDKVTDYLQTKYNMVYDLSNHIHSSELYRILSTINQDSEKSRDYSNISNINAFFQGVCSADADISDIILVTMQNSVFSYSAEGYAEIRPSYPFVEYELLKKLEECGADMYISRENPSVYTLKEREDVITFAGKIFDSSKFPKRIQVAWYLINVPVEKLDILFQENATSNQGDIQVVNRYGELLYTSSDNAGEKGKEACHSEREAGTSGMKVSYSLGEEVLKKSVRIMDRQAVAIVLLICILAVFLGVLISSQFHRRMKALVEAMQRVERGQLDTEVLVASEDEIGQISASFNEMCKKLQNYIDQVYSAEIQRKNAQLNALQAQIDPHFLYNTLESIKSQALKSGDHEAANMVCLLGNLFRWSSNFQEKIVYLEDELDYVRSYLELMNYRFANQLDIDVSIEERYLDYGIPKLILQPIIENTIRHGFSGTGEKKIVGIVVKQKQEKLEITVFDNGKGISKEKLRKIQEGLEEHPLNETGAGVGIRNVHQRIRLMFGSSWGLMIRSIENMGTAIKIVLPAMDKKEMEQFVQDDYSGR
ncbi:MAG: sensor histidine kinase [Candidatus Limivivens sp.]|nr:sensor histidine kinase [Candidatus Limivivens sp.]